MSGRGKPGYTTTDFLPFGEKEKVQGIKEQVLFVPSLRLDVRVSKTHLPRLRLKSHPFVKSRE